MKGALCWPPAWLSVPNSGRNSKLPIRGGQFSNCSQARSCVVQARLWHVQMCATFAPSNQPLGLLFPPCKTQAAILTLHLDFWRAQQNVVPANN